MRGSRAGREESLTGFVVGRMSMFISFLRPLRSLTPGPVRNPRRGAPSSGAIW
jgi:hypothetical protein